MPSNLNLVPAVAAATVVAGFAVKNHIKVVRTERKKREKIRLETQKELLALLRAELMMQKDILNGEYSNRSVADIMTDFEFRRMTARFQD